MGTYQHEVIVVTSNFDQALNEAWKLAFQYKLNTSNIVKSQLDGYKTFVVTTSGSKLGVDDYSHYKLRTKKFMESLNNFADEDGSPPLNIVCVEYGELGTKINYTNRSKSIVTGR